MKRKAERPLTEQQKKAAALLAQTGRVGETARAVGVHRTTLTRWWKKKAFCREFDRQYREAERIWRKKLAAEKRKLVVEENRKIRRLEAAFETAKASGSTAAALRAYDNYMAEIRIVWDAIFND